MLYTESGPMVDLPRFAEPEQEPQFYLCEECATHCNPEESACIDGSYLCPQCFDPKQRAFDWVMAKIEGYEATIMGLKVENRNLRSALVYERQRPIAIKAVIARKDQALGSAYGRLKVWSDDIAAKVMPLPDPETVEEVRLALRVKADAIW